MTLEPYPTIPPRLNLQMPLGKLKDRLRQLCELHGIRFQETEEAYTSKASFLDGDSLPKYGEKPEGWKALLLAC